MESENDQKYFLEVYIEGILSANKEDLKKIEQKINRILAQFVKETNCVKFNSSVAKYSEQELFLAIAPAMDDVEN
jgi:hypothetical protein